MANVLSMDLRVRFKTLMEDGLCAAAAGKTLLLSRATAARWGRDVGLRGTVSRHKGSFSSRQR